MKRRYFLTGLIGVASLPVVRAFAATTDVQGRPMIEKIERSEAEWRQLLTPAQFRVMREEGTEPAWTSALNAEKRKGSYVCAGCDLELFTSDMKYDSGTGWPSFYTTLPDVFGLSDRLAVMKNGKLVGTYRTTDVAEDEVLGMIIAGKQPEGKAQTHTL